MTDKKVKSDFMCGCGDYVGKNKEGTWVHLNTNPRHPAIPHAVEGEFAGFSLSESQLKTLEGEFAEFEEWCERKVKSGKKELEFLCANHQDVYVLKTSWERDFWRKKYAVLKEKFWWVMQKTNPDLEIPAFNNKTVQGFYAENSMEAGFENAEITLTDSFGNEFKPKSPESGEFQQTPKEFEQLPEDLESEQRSCETCQNDPSNHGVRDSCVFLYKFLEEKEGADCPYWAKLHGGRGA